MAKHEPTKLSIHKNIIYRVAQLPMQASLEDSWLQLKESIRLSSPAFYAEIEHLEANDLGNLKGKMKYTLLKYFNRARYRATPYGTFAGVGIFNNNTESSQYLTISSDQEVSRFIDWPLKDQITVMAAQLIAANERVISNSTWYYVNNTIRYVYRNGNKFELCDVPPHPAIKQVLHLTSNRAALHTLRDQLGTACATDSDFEYLIAGMIDLQLLYSERQPNIIGEDYFTRIKEKPNDDKGYLITRRAYIDGGINKKLFRYLPDLAKLFQHLTIKKEGNALERFIDRFIQRYDRRAVPLLFALDPEIGIGYYDMEQAYQSQGIVGDFIKTKQEGGDSPLKLFLARNLPLSGTAEGTVIRLEQHNIQERSNAKPPPNTISALVEVAGDLVQLVSFNGCTATALAGRFSLADEKIHQHCRELAADEQATNYTSLFFDVAYIAEDNVDNVNRRRSIYDYQLTIGNYDTSREPINFSDLLLFIHKQELMLWSKKYNRRLIPRLATAYNYTRSDLPLFRLLCDLQYQGLTTQFNLRLQSIMPNLRFYPRVQFHNIILSPAAWRLDWKEYLTLGQLFPDYLNSRGVSRYVRTGKGDQTLCIDCSDTEGLFILENTLKKEKTLYVEETITPTGNYVKDQEGNCYASQFLLTLQHDAMIYDYVAPVLRPKGVDECPDYLPGSKWLYLELYAHPRQFDGILSQSIQQWLTNNAASISRWFFIRYDEGRHHIRLRAEMNHTDNLPLLTNSITSAVDRNVVYDIQVKTYKPEWERYGIDLMNAVESHFCTDSQYVLSLLSLALDDNTKYHLCIKMIKKIRESGIFPSNVFDLWFKSNMAQWEQEHSLSGPDFKKLNQHFKVFQTTLSSCLDEDANNCRQTFIESMICTLKKAEPMARLSLLSNLIHMHINRLFSYHQRVHEMIVYYFTGKTFEVEQRNHFRDIKTIASD